jgi:hypothetical protein
MRLRTTIAAAAAAAAVAVLAGCGSGTADLMAVHVTGGFVGEDYELRVTDDGRGSCGGPLRPLPSQTVLDAREVKRDMRPFARRGATLPTAGGDLHHYEFRSFDGVVRWDEGRPLPPAIGRATALTLRLKRALCRARG